MKKSNVQLHYGGSKFWLIFWVILFFPVAMILLLTSFQFEMGEKSYLIAYQGSRFWAAFWTVFCFPIAFILMFLNGFEVQTETQSS